MKNAYLHMPVDSETKRYQVCHYNGSYYEFDVMIWGTKLGPFYLQLFTEMYG